MKTQLKLSTLLIAAMSLFGGYDASASVLRYETTLSDANIRLQNFSTSSGYQAGSAVHSTAHWKMLIDLDNETLTYRDLHILNRLQFDSTNTYYLSINEPAVTVTESVILNFDITFPGTDWTVPIEPGVGGLTILSISSYYGRGDSILNIYGDYSFGGPTETLNGSFSHSVAFSSFNRPFGGGTMTFAEGMPEFSDFRFWSMLEMVYPDIGAWVAGTVDGASIYYGDPGVQRVFNGYLGGNTEHRLEIAAIPEPSMSILLAGVGALFVVGIRIRTTSRLKGTSQGRA